MIRNAWTCAARVGVLLSLAVAVAYAQSRSVNGNDFALSYAEARDAAQREALLKAAGRRPHYFRYLQIMEMEETQEEGRTVVNVLALEPASGYDIRFTVRQPVSLAKLRESPVSVPGRALGVSGVIEGVDAERGVISLEPAIVRHKDRLTPAVGKEMVYEFDESGIFYTFTGGREPVRLTYRDRDLLRHRAQILEAQGDQAWADFLKREIDKRVESRQAHSEPKPNRTPPGEKSVEDVP